MEVAVPSNLIGETTMERFPVGGPREPVYAFMRYNGFEMSNWSDKAWSSADGLQARVYGAGSMCQVTEKDGAKVADDPLTVAMSKVAAYRRGEPCGDDKGR
jgi:hypothetical protein